jgi:hypothetical protein
MIESKTLTAFGPQLGLFLYQVLPKNLVGVEHVHTEKKL